MDVLVLFTLERKIVGLADIFHVEFLFASLSHPESITGSRKKKGINYGYYPRERKNTKIGGHCPFLARKEMTEKGSKPRP